MALYSLEYKVHFDLFLDRNKSYSVIPIHHRKLLHYFQFSKIGRVTPGLFLVFVFFFFFFFFSDCICISRLANFF